MEESELVRNAGYAARFFHIDPVAILDGNAFRYAVRIAAYQHVAEAEKQEEERRAAEERAKAPRK